MAIATPFAFKTLPSPVGRLTLVAGDDGLAAVLWQDDRPRRVRLGPLAHQPDHPILREAERQLLAYFAGDLTTFTVPLAFTGTAFQRQVWQALLTIPYGAVRSYTDIARQIGKPAAVRAVGAANGRNPLSIIAPCHRVVGLNGALTGFAGGLAAKEYLLALERRHGAGAVLP
ncbi:methylated-DNA--[protein]-cysteine S-methyltransferase [Nitrospirillum sp. BR 11828]|uniref:methylated-DNA--[protein]-cysteine S-methyltransferase n=1 Tax=Nitrospirillum sp. BR 11828 TaxID=3104325 RepID=UPI002ACA7580|nr:methylated-DNA--[protein]-cysteine S-methyltransferase [Nitrospirillum sp. BR 11828]MDZ5648624.1 methylated-DNA--[protein]-cysteine S-methyltransferase [Nitrospirillum sp. BR 11828]